MATITLIHGVNLLHWKHRRAICTQEKSTDLVQIQGCHVSQCGRETHGYSPLCSLKKEVTFLMDFFNDMKIDIPGIKLEAARKAVYFQGAIIFNELPEHTRKETDFRAFKKQLH